jgi:diguanylate cyclase (GGDEF)-like protein
MLASCTLDVEPFDRVTRTARRVFDAPIASISLVERDRQWFKSCLGLTVRESPRDISFCGHAILQDEALIVEDALADPRFSDNPLVTQEPKIRFYAGRPLRNSEKFKVGALCVIDRRPRRLDPGERQLLDDLGHWAEMLFAATQLSETQRRLLAALEDARHDSMVDPTLHVWNQWAIVDILEREATRAVRHHDALSVLLVDVDSCNPGDERYGQLAGDAVLEKAAHAIRSVLRRYDAVGRYGEGEFLVVLPDSDRSTATSVAQRLRDTIESTMRAAGRQCPICTVRTGVAWLDPHTDACSAEALVARADDALLQAKRA